MHRRKAMIMPSSYYCFVSAFRVIFCNLIPGHFIPGELSWNGSVGKIVTRFCLQWRRASGACRRPTDGGSYAVSRKTLLYMPSILVGVFDSTFLIIIIAYCGCSDGDSVHWHRKGCIIIGTTGMDVQEGLPLRMHADWRRIYQRRWLDGLLPFSSPSMCHTIP